MKKSLIILMLSLPLLLIFFVGCANQEIVREEPIAKENVVAAKQPDAQQATLDNTKAMVADAVKIPRVTVKSTDREILITVLARNIFSANNKIRATGRATLDEVASYLKKYPTGAVTVRCYDNSSGKAETKRVLTEKRAQKVKDYLVVFHNVSPDRIISKGLGSTQPVADNNTASGRALNRRIEIGIAIGQ